MVFIVGKYTRQPWDAMGKIPSPTFPKKNLINIKLERKFSQSSKKNRITRKQLSWKQKKHLKILGDPLSTELNPGSTHRHPPSWCPWRSAAGLSGKKKAESLAVPTKTKGKRWEMARFLCWLWQVFVGLKSLSLWWIWQIAANPMRMKTLQTCRLTPTLSCEGWEKSGGYCLFVWVSSRIKISEVHLDMVNCGGDGDQYCPVRLLCPKKQTIARKHSSSCAVRRSCW